MKRFLILAVSLIMLLATVASASACVLGGHQPELPEALK